MTTPLHKGEFIDKPRLIRPIMQAYNKHQKGNADNINTSHKWDVQGNVKLIRKVLLLGLQLSADLSVVIFESGL